MKSVKPGRAPSFAGFIASVILILFGIAWTFLVIHMFDIHNDHDDPVMYFFVLFGIVFVGAGLASAVYNYKNAYDKNRFSLFDVVDADQEPDAFGRRNADHYNGQTQRKNTSRYCTQCGSPMKSDYQFCPDCGKKAQ